MNNNLLVSSKSSFSSSFRPRGSVNSSSTGSPKRSPNNKSSIIVNNVNNNNNLKDINKSLSLVDPNVPTPRTSNSALPSFDVEKFYRARAHLSTDSERLAALACIMKDSSNRSKQDLLTIAKFLQTIEIFSSLKLEICIELAKICKYCKFIRDAIIYKQKEKPNLLYVILTGTVGNRVKSFSLYSRTINNNNNHANDHSITAAQTLSATQLVSVSSAEIISEEEEEEDFSTNTYYNNFLDRSKYSIAAVMGVGESFGTEGLYGTGSGSNFIPTTSRNSTAVANELCELLALDVYDYHTILDKYSDSEIKERLLFLKDLPLFADIDIKSLWKVAVQLQSETYQRDTVIIKQGDKNEKMCFIKSGECRVLHRLIKNKNKLKADNTDKNKNISNSLIDNNSSMDNSVTESIDNLDETLGSISSSYSLSTNSNNKSNDTDNNNNDINNPDGTVLELNVLGAGNYFGELSIINESRHYSCSVLCSSIVHVYSLSADDFLHRMPQGCIDYMQFYAEKMYLSTDTIQTQWKKHVEWRNFKKKLVEQITAKRRRGNNRF